MARVPFKEGGQEFTSLETTLPKLSMAPTGILLKLLVHKRLWNNSKQRTGKNHSEAAPCSRLDVYSLFYILFQIIFNQFLFMTCQIQQ